MNGALDRGERMVAVDERRLHADVDRAVDERRRADEADDHVELARRLRRAAAGSARCPRRSTSSSVDPRAERDRREDRHLRGGVGAGDVLGRVGLRVAEPLRLGERVASYVAPRSISREDEVGRPVDDPEHAVHVRDDERLAQHLDHRDRRADGRLEAKLDARLGRGREELGAAPRDELLVRRDDGLAGAEQLEHVVRRSARAPPMTSATTAIAGSSRISAKSVVSTPSVRRNPRSFAGSRTSARTTRSRWPVARSMSSALSSSSRSTAEPTVP